MTWHLAQTVPPDAVPVLWTATSRWLVAASWAAAAFVLTTLLTGRLIGWLAHHQLGKAIRADGPDHAAKAGTPTLGGLALLAVVAALGLGLAWLNWQSGALLRESAAAAAQAAGQATAASTDTAKAADALQQGAASILVALGAALVFAVIGVLDDWAGLARRGRARELGVGLGARHMLALQIAAGVMVVAALAHVLSWSSPSTLPPTSTANGVSTVVPFALACLVALVAVVGTVNGVNFSDGLDELAVSLCAWAFGGLGVVLSTAHGLGQRQIFLLKGFALGPPPLAVFSWIIAGACLGFWVHNRHPARVFMGNVTSMALGALLATLTIAGLGHGPERSLAWAPFLLVLGAVFAIEVSSDIIQIGYFKLTHGKRFFRMAPLHHHFEAGGWHETDVVRVFRFAGFLAAVATVVMAVVAFGK